MRKIVGRGRSTNSNWRENYSQDDLESEKTMTRCCPPSRPPATRAQHTPARAQAPNPRQVHPARAPGRLRDSGPELWPALLKQLPTRRRQRETRAAMPARHRSTPSPASLTAATPTPSSRRATPSSAPDASMQPLGTEQLQWTTLPPHSMAPVSCNGSGAPYNGPKFEDPTINPPIDLENPTFNLHSTSQITNRYNLINAPRVGNHGLNSNLLTPNVQNTAALNGRNGWMTPVSSTSQFTSRAPTWNVTRSSVPKKPKRIRTAFTSQQMMELEQEYARTRYLDRSRRIELAKILHLNERTIKIWFQNRRMKEKKDRQESLEDSEETMESSPEHGNIPMPVLAHNDYPTPVTDAIFKQDIYEQYPDTSTPLPASNLPHSIDSQMMNGYTVYPEYTQEQLAFEYRQLQMQDAMYVNETQEISPLEAAPRRAAVGGGGAEPADGSTDVSWIRVIYPEDEP